MLGLGGLVWCGWCGLVRCAWSRRCWLVLSRRLRLASVASWRSSRAAAPLFLAVLSTPLGSHMQSLVAMRPSCGVALGGLMAARLGPAASAVLWSMGAPGCAVEQAWPLSLSKHGQ